MREFEKLTNGAKVPATGLGFRVDNGDHSAQIVRFGLFEADLQTGELRESGVKVPLQGQPFQVCAIPAVTLGRVGHQGGSAPAGLAGRYVCRF